MTQPSEGACTSRGQAYGWALVTIAAVVGISLWMAGPVPWNDEGGYLVMARYFARTGTVDFMRWCQPTFLGVLPVAAPVAALAGGYVPVFGLVGVAYFVFFVGGLYVFALPHTGCRAAFVLSLSVFAVGELVVLMPSFMTDIPYLAYIVWLLVLQRSIENRWTSCATPSILWAGWSAAFLLAVLVRPFVVAIIAVFAIGSVFARSPQRELARRFLAVSVVLVMAAFCLLHALAVNRFTIVEQTIYEELVKEHGWARLDLRELGLAVLYLAVVLAPVLIVWAPAHRARLTATEFAVAAIVAGVAVRLWLKGRIEPIVVLLGPSDGARWITAVQALAAPIGAVVVFRIWRWGSATRKSTLPPTLALLLVSQLAVLPFMQHPLLRHALPALVSAVMLASMSGLTTARVWWSTSIAMLAVLAAGSIAQVWCIRRENAVRWAACEALVGEGVPLDEIDGGWSWFCFEHLRPGASAPGDYRLRYYGLQQAARFEVTGAEFAPAAGTDVRSVIPVAASPFRRRIFVIDRRPANPPAGAGVECAPGREH